MGKGQAHQLPNKEWNGLASEICDSQLLFFLPELNPVFLAGRELVLRRQRKRNQIMVF